MITALRLYSAFGFNIMADFEEYDCLLEASDFFGRQQLLAEAYSGKLKLKVFRILVTHHVYKILYRSYQLQLKLIRR